MNDPRYILTKRLNDMYNVIQSSIARFLRCRRNQQDLGGADRASRS